MPKVSVIVPNYNHARFLQRRIDSILDQTFQDFELILLDDCSTDESRSILDRYRTDRRIQIEFNSTNSGSTFKQWNKGVRLARGEYVWIAESDDYAAPQLLEKFVSRLDADPCAVLCNCRSWEVSSREEINGFLDSRHLADIDPKRWTKDFCADGHEECRKYLVRRNTIVNGSAVIFRRKIFEQVGGADESFVFCGDWKLWAAMALTGGRILYIGEPLNYFRSHQDTVTARSLSSGVDAAEYLRVIRWILQGVTPTEATLEMVCNELFPAWQTRVLTKRVPLGRRWAILKDAMAVDPKALRKLVRAALAAFRMRLSRRLLVVAL